jgi:hypothetical protein
MKGKYGGGGGRGEKKNRKLDVNGVEGTLKKIELGSSVRTNEIRTWNSDMQAQN